jgi:DNA topoisomerase-1
MKHYKKKTEVSILQKYQKRKEGKQSETIRIANTPYLVILESPSKCKKIEHYLGFQYKCIASNGHIRGLTRIKRSKTKENDSFEPVFDILPEKAAHVEYMREIIRHFLPTPENIFIATDDDREGEAIGWHICQTFGLPVDRVRRMIFHEITEKVIQNAARNTTSIRMGIVFAQQARQMLDQMVGFEISPLLTKRLSGSEPLSAGRCQTPALRFVYDKQKDGMDTNRGEMEYRVTGSFFSQIPSATSFPFPLEATLTESLATESEVEMFLEQSKKFAHAMTLGIPTKRSISPPIPFHTSTFLQYTNNRWNMSPKMTMSYCQLLYQHGYITYMRTESTKYSEVFLEQVRNYLSTEMFRKDFAILLDETGHNPHEAIRVTNIQTSSIDPLSLSLGDGYSERDQKRIAEVYEAIWRRSIQSCMCAYEYKHVDVFFSAAQEKRYHTSLEIPVIEGFYSIGSSSFSSSLEEEEEEKEEVEKKKGKKEKENKQISFQEKQIQMNGLYSFLQSVQNPIHCLTIEARFQLQKKTKSRFYTESSLIQTLEDHGIGRPSTYALLVETIQEREYVKKQDIEGTVVSGVCFRWNVKEGIISRTLEEKRFGQEKNKLVLQPLGKLVIETLIPTFDGIFSYDYTREMERKLDDISATTSFPEVSSAFDICKEMEIELKKHTIPWKKEMQEKYEIDDTYELFFSKKGRFIREKKGDRCLEEENTLTGIQRVRNINIDLEKLKRKEYTLEELLEIPRELMGVYQEKEVRLKNGKFGPYLLWGEETITWTPKDKALWDITLEDIIHFLQLHTERIPKKDTKSSEGNILRVISESLEIRKGKFGNYIYHHLPVKVNLEKTEKTEKKGKKESPFFNIKCFPGDWQTCENNELLEWIHKTYGIR